MRALAVQAAGGVRSNASCPACQLPENAELRTSPRGWGCDTPAVIPVFWITCPYCNGAEADCGLGPDASSRPIAYTNEKTGEVHREGCRGSGRMSVHRCVNKYVGDRDDLYRALEMYATCRSMNTLPVAGAMMDQSASFYTFIRIFQAEVASRSKD